MTESQNVQIPLSLFRKIMTFFEFTSVSSYTFPAFYEFNDIITELREKQHKINLRTVYTKTIYAKDNEQRHLAQRDYLKLKNMH